MRRLSVGGGGAMVTEGCEEAETAEVAAVATEAAMLLLQACGRRGKERGIT